MKPIRFAQMNETPIKYTPLGYRFFKPRKHKWLARLLWWGLQKLKALAPFEYEVTIHTYGPAEQKKVDEAIMEHIDHVASKVFMEGKEWDDYALIMGGETFHELTGILMKTMITVPSGRFHFNFNGGTYGNHFSGFPVHVIPFHTGTALVPKVLIEKVDNSTGT